MSSNNNMGTPLNPLASSSGSSTRDPPDPPPTHDDRGSGSGWNGGGGGGGSEGRVAPMWNDAPSMNAQSNRRLNWLRQSRTDPGVEAFRPREYR